MMKVRFHILFIALAVTAICSVVAGCSKPAASAGDGRAIVRREIRTSQAGEGRAIASRTQLLTPVKEGQVVIVQVVFIAKPYQDIWLDIAQNDAFELDGDYHRVLKGGKNGMTVENIKLVPNKAGKTYLKMTASYAGGRFPSEVVVALPVENEQGHMPKKTRKIKDRIEYQAAPVR